MIVVFSPCHGRSDIAAASFASIEANVPGPFDHLVFDDYSPPEDEEWYQQSGGWLSNGGERDVIRCKGQIAKEKWGFEDAPPNLGRTLGVAWKIAKDMEAEALLAVESDVILRPGVVEAFREAEVLHKGNAGAIAPIFTRVGENTIDTFGGVPENKMGLSRGLTVGSWPKDSPRIDVLPWAHLACLWIPGYVLANNLVMPDPQFRLYWQDRDLNRQIQRAGYELIVVDGAVAEHTRDAASTRLLDPELFARVGEVVYTADKSREAGDLLHAKWGF